MTKTEMAKELSSTFVGFCKEAGFRAAIVMVDPEDEGDNLISYGSYNNKVLMELLAAGATKILTNLTGGKDITGMLRERVKQLSGEPKLEEASHLKELTKTVKF